MIKMGFRYSEIHIDFLRCGFKEMRIPELTMAFNKKFKADKSVREIRSALKNRKITCGRKGGFEKGSSLLFSPDQVEFIRARYSTLSRLDLVVAVNKKFSLQVSVSQITNFVKYHKIRSGRTGRYQAGNVPWTAGKKGKGVCKPNSGSFKKGDIPGNIKTLGSERSCSAGSILVKIAEANPYTGAKTRYKAKHRVVWEKHHGPIPKDKMILFLDGDPGNCARKNLNLIDRPCHLRLSQSGYRNTPDEFRPSVLAIAQLETKVFKLARAEK